MSATDPPSSKPPCDRADALAVLARLRQFGHEAYFAGGCVRDMLLKLEPKDWDIATDAPPDRVREIFSNTQAVGAAFGVILVRHAKSVVEVATFRADGVYEDGRRPSSVRFTSASEDAQRRDFTINGLFYDPLENRVIDFVNGRADLDAKILRAVGDPSQRFAEDHLRLLRAVRFAARFDLKIEPQTAAAIRQSADRLKGISPERIGEELRLMLTPPTRTAAWKLLWDLDLAPILFRFMPTIPAGIDMNQSIFMHLSPGNTIPFGLALAAASLCVDRNAHPQTPLIELLDNRRIAKSVHAMRQALRISNTESDEMLETLDNLRPLLQADPPGIATRKRFLAERAAELSQILMQAMARVGIEKDRIEKILAGLSALSREEIAPPPLLTGDDLVAAGFPPGPKFKQILDAVYDAQLEGRVTSKEAALELARNL
ncbi:MAG: CCA tRNA nucleotidyltransferase [Tepidisphaeraceae bacterium]